MRNAELECLAVILEEDASPTKDLEFVELVVVDSYVALACSSERQRNVNRVYNGRCVCRGRGNA